MLNVSSINVQNRYKEKRYCGFLKNKNINLMVANYIIDNKIDVAGAQELLPNSIKYISDYLKEYDIKGKTRYRFILKKIFKKIDETNSIITNLEIIRNKTIHLPHFPAFLPRIATVSILRKEEVGDFCFINTHLSYETKKARNLELVKLLKIIDKYKEYPIILAGDFNTNIKNPDFIKFMDKLKQFNIERVELNNKTYKYSKTNMAIDHIFVSNFFEVVKKQIVEDEKNDFSDHYPLFISIKKRYS